MRPHTPDPTGVPGLAPELHKSKLRQEQDIAAARERHHFETTTRLEKEVEVLAEKEVAPPPRLPDVRTPSPACPFLSLVMPQPPKGVPMGARAAARSSTTVLWPPRGQATKTGRPPCDRSCVYFPRLPPQQQRQTQVQLSIHGRAFVMAGVGSLQKYSGIPVEWLSALIVTRQAWVYPRNLPA